MKYCSRWSLPARIVDFAATFGALRTLACDMACRDSLLHVILFPPAAPLLTNVSRVFGQDGANAHDAPTIVPIACVSNSYHILLCHIV